MTSYMEEHAIYTIIIIIMSNLISTSIGVKKRHVALRYKPEDLWVCNDQELN